MATNFNSQREMYDYLQSLYYQNMANRGSNHYSTGVIPEEGPGAGWMAQFGGVPPARNKGRGVVTPFANRPAMSPAALRKAKRAYNKMIAEQKGGGGDRFDPANFLPPQQQGQPFPTFSPNDFMPQYSGPQASQGWQGYPPGYQPSIPPQIRDRVNQTSQAPQPQGPTLYEQVAQSYLDQTNAANAKNEERYAQGKGLAEETSRLNAEDIVRLGAQQSADIRRDYDRAGKAEYANLVGRGLAGSTVAGAVQRRVLDEQTQNLNRLQDQIVRQQIDSRRADNRNTQDFIERRNDIAPDMSMLAKLSQGLGAGNNGQGFGYLPQTQGLYTQDQSTGANSMYQQPRGYQQPRMNRTGYQAAPGQQAMPSQPFAPDASGYYTGQQQSYGGSYNAYGNADLDASRQAYQQGQMPMPGTPSTMAPQSFGGYQTANVGGRQILQGGPKPIDYAAAEQYKMNYLTPQQGQQRYQPSYGGGGGGYGGFRQMPGPIFANAGALGYSIPNASYGMQGGGGYGVSGSSSYLGAPRRRKPVASRTNTRANTSQLTSPAFQDYRQKLYPSQYGY